MAKKCRWFLILPWLLAVFAVRGQAQTDTLNHADWKLYWTNEFGVPGDSSVVAGHWQFAYPWGRNLGGFEDQYYTGEQVNVDRAGVLQLTARRRDAPRAYAVGGSAVRQLHYDAGMIYSSPVKDTLGPAGYATGRAGFAYGLFEIRCRLPRTPSSFSSFWLFGHPDEVDVFETGAPEAITNNIILHNHSFWRRGPLDAAGEASQSLFYWTGPRPLADDFHTLAVSWQPQELVYYFDGIAIRHETRLLPLGIPLSVISNLGMPVWSKEGADSLGIDYIRVYKARALPRAPLAPVAPAPGMMQEPHTTAAVLGGAGSRQRWGLLARPDRRPRLALQHNRNPRDFNTLALPVQGHWLTPLLAFNDTETPQHWLASPDSSRSALSWALYDLCGKMVRSGQQLPAASWPLAWPGMAPGAYSLRLRIGPRQVRQTVFILGRPEEVVFSPEWLRVPPPTAAN